MFGLGKIFAPIKAFVTTKKQFISISIFALASLSVAAQVTPAISVELSSGNLLIEQAKIEDVSNATLRWFDESWMIIEESNLVGTGSLNLEKATLKDEVVTITGQFTGNLFYNDELLADSGSSFVIELDTFGNILSIETSLMSGFPIDPDGISRGKMGFPVDPDGLTKDGGYPTDPDGFTEDGGYPTDPDGLTEDGGYPTDPDGSTDESGYPTDPDGLSVIGFFPQLITANAEGVN